MSYRKITVNDVVYEYTIGISHLKIKGVGVFESLKCASVKHFDDDYDGEPIGVTPADVRKVILDPKAYA